MKRRHTFIAWGAGPSGKTEPPARCRARRHAAFTLVELLIVIVIIVLLAAILLPAYNGVRTRMMRSKCASNLKEIARGCITYADDSTKNRPANNRALPSVGPQQNDSSGRAWWRWDQAADETQNPKGNANSMWLLVRYGLCTPDEFICPEAAVRLSQHPAVPSPHPSVPGDHGFSPATCSYSYLSQVGYNPGPTPGLSLVAPGISIGTAIVGDRNPHVDVELPYSGSIINDGVWDANSLNHGGEWSIFVTIQQNVVQIKDPDTEAPDDDNPYNTGGSFSAGTRGNIGDSFLL